MKTFSSRSLWFYPFLYWVVIWIQNPIYWQLTLGQSSYCQGHHFLILEFCFDLQDRWFYSSVIWFVSCRTIPFDLFCLQTLIISWLILSFQRFFPGMKFQVIVNAFWDVFMLSFDMFEPVFLFIFTFKAKCYDRFTRFDHCHCNGMRFMGFWICWGFRHRLALIVCSRCFACGFGRDRVFSFTVLKETYLMRLYYC